MTAIHDKIWNGEYWGKNGGLIESLLTFPKDTKDNGLLSTLIERVSHFYSAAGAAQKMRNRGKIWTVRYYACAAATFFFWSTAHVLGALFNPAFTVGQYDVMGTVGRRFGCKKIAKKYLLTAIRRFVTKELPLHERALPICQFLLLEPGNGGYYETLYFGNLCGYLDVPADLWPNQNQLARVLRATIEYERKIGQNEMADTHRAKLEKLLIGDDQKLKSGL